MYFCSVFLTAGANELFSASTKVNWRWRMPYSSEVGNLAMLRNSESKFLPMTDSTGSHPIRA